MNELKAQQYTVEKRRSRAIERCTALGFHGNRGPKLTSKIVNGVYEGCRGWIAGGGFTVGCGGVKRAFLARQTYLAHVVNNTVDPALPHQV